jgi:COP9 signalosome complex subunit 1
MLHTKLLTRPQETTALEIQDDMNRVNWIISNYSSRYLPGRERGIRLAKVASNAVPKSLLRRAALEKSFDEFKSSRDSHGFKMVMQLAQNGNTPIPNDASIWLERVERENRVQRQQLESAVNRYKSEGVKENIRSALDDLGRFFRECGDSTNAFKTFLQVKEFCSTPQDHLTASLRLLEIAVESGTNFHHIGSSVSRIEHYVASLPATSKNIAISATNIMHAACAIKELDNKKYKLAAKQLVAIVGNSSSSSSSSSSGNSDSTQSTSTSRIMIPEDVATYGTICAMATFSRSELKEFVVDNQKFKPLLETVPDVRNMLQCFVESKYRDLALILQSSVFPLRLDPTLSQHAEFLLKSIRVQALSQYVAPYSNLRLEKLADAFGTDVSNMEKEIAQLIARGTIQARIDSQNKVLVARGESQRDAAYSNAIRVGDMFTREAKSVMFRVSLLENYLVYNPEQNKQRSQQQQHKSGKHDDDVDDENVDEVMGENPIGGGDVVGMEDVIE